MCANLLSIKREYLLSFEAAKQCYLCQQAGDIIHIQDTLNRFLQNPILTCLFASQSFDDTVHFGRHGMAHDYKEIESASASGLVESCS
jgi:lactam utilization protein B